MLLWVELEFDLSYAFLQIAVVSIVARSNSMTSSFIWPLMKLSTLKPKRYRHRLTAYASGFIRPFCKSFTKSLSVKNYMRIWKACKKIWTSGSIITIMKELIRVRFVMAKRQWKLYSVGN